MCSILKAIQLSFSGTDGLNISQSINEENIIFKMLVWNQDISPRNISSNSDTEARSKEKSISYYLFQLNPHLYSVIQICRFNISAAPFFFLFQHWNTPEYFLCFRKLYSVHI